MAYAHDNHATAITAARRRQHGEFLIALYYILLTSKCTLSPPLGRLVRNGSPFESCGNFILCIVYLNRNN